MQDTLVAVLVVFCAISAGFCIGATVVAVRGIAKLSKQLEECHRALAKISENISYDWGRRSK